MQLLFYLDRQSDNYDTSDYLFTNEIIDRETLLVIWLIRQTPPKQTPSTHPSLPSSFPHSLALSLTLSLTPHPSSVDVTPPSCYPDDKKGKKNSPFVFQASGINSRDTHVVFPRLCLPYTLCV